jgi:hypothetical protein
VGALTSEYLSTHGISVYERDPQNLSILGFVFERLAPGKTATTRKKWTDSQGSEVTDLKVYWTYADRSTGDKLPPGFWRLRLAHYAPRGEIKLLAADGGCRVSFDLFFQTSGANVAGIIPMDSNWSYRSNGILERGYLKGISEALSAQ